MDEKTNDYIFFLSFAVIVAASFLIGYGVDIVIWLLSIFLLIVFIPLLFYSAIKDFRKT